MQSDHYRLIGSYDRLRRTLLELPEDGRLDKSLAYWVIPTDRRLPIAFLDRSLRELLQHPLDELMATPGVGQKKILGFFDLLRRAARSLEVESDFGMPTPPRQVEAAFDPTTVSESVWATWCETVNRHQLVTTKLGRLAPSLQSLPSVIWEAPLGNYSEQSLAQIRGLKTHGQKRVEAILEVFCIVHESMSTSVLPESLDLHLAPAFISPLTAWLVETHCQTSPPRFDEIHKSLATPLVRQIDQDLGPAVGDLLRGRFRPQREVPTVRQQAEDLGVTRARVYQLFDDCARVMNVRWPEGRLFLRAAEHRMHRLQSEALSLVVSIRELLFPEASPIANRNFGETRVVDC